MTRLLLALCAIVALSPAASAAEFRWAFATAMAGNLVASVQNADGSSLRIACEAGGSGAPSIEYESTKVTLAKKERVQIVVGDAAFPFDFEPYGDSSLAELTARGSRSDMTRMVAAILATRAASLTVEVPRMNASETFSLKDAGKALRRKKGTITDPCL